MSRLPLVACLLALVSAVGSGVSAVQLSRASASLDALDGKVAALEKGGGGDSGKKDSAGAREVSAEVAKLRAELERLQAAQKDILSRPAGSDQLTLADLKKEIENALAEKQKAFHLRQVEMTAKQARSWAAKQAGTYAKALHLTEQQAKDVAQVMNDQVEAYKEVWAAPSLGPAELERIGRINDETAAKIRGLLNEEQAQAWDQTSKKWFIDSGGR